MNANETILYLKELLIDYLNDLQSVGDKPDTLFAYGEKTAYTECLEVLQRWENAKTNGLDFDIEKRYPL